ncbi:MAG: hypothetical protein MJZ91_08930 [Bacteroidales bacterium]|nr:hypothetical protein [Bacteroidales bacterium]
MKKMILMLCLVLSGAFCFAHSEEGKLGKGDEITIDSIRVYQLKTDCDTDETIASQSDLDSFEYAVKKSISIIPFENIVIDTNDKMTLRVTDSFEITGTFQIDAGAEFTVIKQECQD